MDSFGLHDCWSFIKIPNKKVCHPKICHVHIVYCDLKSTSETATARILWPFVVPWKHEINLTCERYPPRTGRAEASLSWKTGNLGPRRLYKPTLLPLHQFTTPSSNLFVLSILHKCIVSISKRHKSFLPWWFLWVSLFLWGAHTYKIKFVYFLLICFMLIE